MLNEEAMEIIKAQESVSMEVEGEVASQIGKLMDPIDHYARCRIMLWLAERIRADATQTITTLNKLVASVDAKLEELAKMAPSEPSVEVRAEQSPTDDAPSPRPSG